jgi:hypothetical protein
VLDIILISRMRRLLRYVPPTPTLAKEMADESRKFILSIHSRMISTHMICRSWSWGTSGLNSITSRKVSQGTHEQNWANGTEALICDINVDVKVALNSLARPEWAKFSTHPFLEARRGGSAGFSA